MFEVWPDIWHLLNVVMREFDFCGLANTKYSAEQGCLYGMDFIPYISVDTNFTLQ